MNALVLKIAEAEFDSAVDYYESEQSGLGARFRMEVMRAINRMVEFPLAYQKLSANTR